MLEVCLKKEKHFEGNKLQTIYTFMLLFLEFWLHSFLLLITLHFDKPTICCWQKTAIVFHPALHTLQHNLLEHLIGLHSALVIELVQIVEKYMNKFHVFPECRCVLDKIIVYVFPKLSVFSILMECLDICNLLTVCARFSLLTLHIIKYNSTHTSIDYGTIRCSEWLHSRIYKAGWMQNTLLLKTADRLWEQKHSQSKLEITA